MNYHVSVLSYDQLHVQKFEIFFLITSHRIENYLDFSIFVYDLW